MDLKQLKFLLALEATRHFGAAAARCHVTQPTLSMRLRQLEDELGLELVRRGQRFEGFTEAGERILAWAHQVLAAQDGLLAEAALSRGSLAGKLRLGLVPLSGFDPLPALRTLSQRYPRLRFALSANSSEQIIEQLRSNRLDLGIAYLDRPDTQHLIAQPLARTQMALLFDHRHFAPPDAPLDWGTLTALPLGALSRGMHFRQSIDHAFRARGLDFTPLIETDAVHQLLQAVQAGFCCAILPCDSGLERLGGHLRLCPIAEAPTLAPVSLLMRRDAPRSPLAEACFELLADALPDKPVPGVSSSTSIT